MIELITSKKIPFQLMHSKFEYDGKLNPAFKEGAFQLPLSSIRAYLEDPITPRFCTFILLNESKYSLSK